MRKNVITWVLRLCIHIHIHSMSLEAVYAFECRIMEKQKLCTLHVKWCQTDTHTHNTYVCVCSSHDVAGIWVLITQEILLVPRLCCWVTDVVVI